MQSHQENKTSLAELHEPFLPIIAPERRTITPLDCARPEQKEELPRWQKLLISTLGVEFGVIMASAMTLANYDFGKNVLSRWLGLEYETFSGLGLFCAGMTAIPMTTIMISLAFDMLSFYCSIINKGCSLNQTRIQTYCQIGNTFFVFFTSFSSMQLIHDFIERLEVIPNSINLILTCNNGIATFVVNHRSLTLLTDTITSWLFPISRFNAQRQELIQYLAQKRHSFNQMDIETFEVQVASLLEVPSESTLHILKQFALLDDAFPSVLDQPRITLTQKIFNLPTVFKSVFFGGLGLGGTLFNGYLAARALKSVWNYLGFTVSNSLNFTFGVFAFLPKAALRINQSNKLWYLFKKCFINDQKRCSQRSCREISKIMLIFLALIPIPIATCYSSYFTLEREGFEENANIFFGLLSYFAAMPVVITFMNRMFNALFQRWDEQRVLNEEPTHQHREILKRLLLDCLTALKNLPDDQFEVFCQQLKTTALERDHNRLNVSQKQFDSKEVPSLLFLKQDRGLQQVKVKRTHSLNNSLS